MTRLDAFRNSLTESEPPAGSSLAVQALWWAARGDWDRAHGCAQQREGDPACDRVHGWLHWQEGDVGNARYWYRRAGQPFPSGSLDEEWSAIAMQLLEAAA